MSKWMEKKKEGKSTVNQKSAREIYKNCHKMEIYWRQ